MTQEEKDMDKSDPKSINDNIPYKESEVICVNCSYRWFAERPVTKPLKDIECPWCGKQGFVIETGETMKQITRKI
jgi:DNA-directed RNA polymerase subunit RPC12/RpoP